jgi:hypothetical protein
VTALGHENFQESGPTRGDLPTYILDDLAQPIHYEYVSFLSESGHATSFLHLTQCRCPSAHERLEVEISLSEWLENKTIRFDSKTQ